MRALLVPSCTHLWDPAVRCMLQVMLSTVHAVKGLECVVCFVVGLDDRTWKTNFVPTNPAEVKQVSLLCQH